jgi:hypothetical protein
MVCFRYVSVNALHKGDDDDDDDDDDRLSFKRRLVLSAEETFCFYGTKLPLLYV